MKRREFAKKALLSAAAVTPLAACSSESDSGAPAVHTRQRVRWRLVSSFQSGLDVLFSTAQDFADRVAALTDGAFEIRVYPAGEIVPGLQVLDAVQQGTVQAGHSASYYYTGKNPSLAFDTGVPFGLTSRGYNAWLLHGGGMELMREVFSDFNIVNLPGGNTGAQMGGWFNRPIRSLDDMKGLRMRIPGFGGEVMTRLGVSVQVLGGADVYQALDRGALDATEWVGPYDDEKLGFHQVVNYYHYPGWWEPGPATTFYINQRAWAELPAGYREVLESASRASSLYMTSLYDARNPPALQRLLDAGVQLVEFPDEVMDAGLREWTDLSQQHAAVDPMYRRISEQIDALRKTTYQWFGTSDHSYETFAFKRMT